jgi:DNA-3-methyladenine glycosylase
MHTCLNVVTEPAGRPAAVLIRAVQLIDGVAAARSLRLRRESAVKGARDEPARQAASAARISATPTERLAAGPGLVGAAFGLDPALTGLDLCNPAARLRLETGGLVPGEVVRATPRIGIGYAGEPWVSRPWRFAIAGNPAVSGQRGRS